MIAVMADESNEIFRNSRRFFPTTYFIFFGLAVTPNFGSRDMSLRLLSIFATTFCGFYAWRVVQSGYLRIDQETIVLRTVLRRRVFQIDQIRNVEAKRIFQFTSRVVPFITFLDGSTYKMSDFFMQQARFDREPDDNLITVIITTISERLRTHPAP